MNWGALFFWADIVHGYFWMSDEDTMRYEICEILAL